MALASLECRRAAVVLDLRSGKQIQAGRILDLLVDGVDYDIGTSARRVLFGDPSPRLSALRPVQDYCARHGWNIFGGGTIHRIPHDERGLLEFYRKQCGFAPTGHKNPGKRTVRDVENIFPFVHWHDADFYLVYEFTLPAVAAALRALTIPIFHDGQPKSVSRRQEDLRLFELLTANLFDLVNDQDWGALSDNGGWGRIPFDKPAASWTDWRLQNLPPRPRCGLIAAMRRVAKIERYVRMGRDSTFMGCNAHNIYSSVADVRKLTIKPSVQDPRVPVGLYSTARHDQLNSNGLPWKTSLSVAAALTPQATTAVAASQVAGKVPNKVPMPIGIVVSDRKRLLPAEAVQKRTDVYKSRSSPISINGLTPETFKVALYEIAEPLSPSCVRDPSWLRGPGLNDKIAPKLMNEAFYEIHKTVEAAFSPVKRQLARGYPKGARFQGTNLLKTMRSLFKSRPGPADFGYEGRFLPDLDGIGSISVKTKAETLIPTVPLPPGAELMTQKDWEIAEVAAASHYRIGSGAAYEPLLR